MFASETSYVYKNCIFAAKNCIFTIFLLNCKLKMHFWNNLIFYLPNKLLHKINCLKIAIFILQFTIKWSKRNFLLRKCKFFVNVTRFAHKHFWASVLWLLAYSKLVGTPCTNIKNNHQKICQTLFTLQL